MLCLGLGLLMPLSVPASSENDAAGTEEISWVLTIMDSWMRQSRHSWIRNWGIFMRSMVMMPYF